MMLPTAVQAEPIYPHLHWCLDCDIRWRDVRPDSTCDNCGRAVGPYYGTASMGTVHRHRPEAVGDIPYTTTL